MLENSMEYVALICENCGTYNILRNQVAEGKACLCCGGFLLVLGNAVISI